MWYKSLYKSGFCSGSKICSNTPNFETSFDLKLFGSSNTSPSLFPNILVENQPAGWFSTNILGNRDGEVLDDPNSFKSKEVSKLGVLEQILEPEQNPDLYKDLYHKVRINYYPPHGDNKEGWDNIDIFGWLGYKMHFVT